MDGLQKLRLDYLVLAWTNWGKRMILRCRNYL